MQEGFDWMQPGSVLRPMSFLMDKKADQSERKLISQTYIYLPHFSSLCLSLLYFSIKPHLYRYNVIICGPFIMHHVLRHFHSHLRRLFLMPLNSSHLLPPKTNVTYAWSLTMKTIDWMIYSLKLYHRFVWCSCCFIITQVKNNDNYVIFFHQSICRMHMIKPCLQGIYHRTY